MFTQPTMYSIIKKHPNVLDIYGKKLVRLTTIKSVVKLDNIHDGRWARAW